MEARTNSVPRASQTGHRQGSLGANRRESSRSLATRELARPQHCLTQRLLCGARASTHGLHGVSLIRRTAVCGPACTVVWQGRRGDPLPYAASVRCILLTQTPQALQMVATSPGSIHHESMIRRLVLGGFAVVCLSAALSFAGIVEDVRRSLTQQDFPSAESALGAYRAKFGVTPEYLEALSWMGRGALALERYPQAETYASQTLMLAAPQIKGRSVDSDDHLATAIGAGYEVQALALAGQGHKAQATAVLRRALQTYGNTS